MNIDELIKEAHAMAKGKGWWDEPRSPLEIHALIHSEVSEATECVRAGEPPIHHRVCKDSGMKLGKPEGEVVELADVIIRIADWCGYNGWDLESAIKEKLAYNATRPYKHGKKI